MEASRTDAVLARTVSSVPLVGICEPSGATQTPDGSIWIADDDQNDVLFQWNDPALKPLARTIPHTTDASWVKDIEGITWRDGALWLMGSHSLSRKGKRKRRARIITLDARALTPIATEPSLWPDTTAESPAPLRSALAAHCPTCAPAQSWSTLNLEGIAWSAHHNTLWAGARAPLNQDGSAYLFALQPDETGGLAEPPITGVHTLPLGGRGVRSLSPVGNGSSILVLAGPAQDAGPADGQFAIFHWTPGNAPQHLADLPALAGSPEAILPIDTHEAWVFVDEGDRLQQLAKASPAAPHRKMTDKGVQFQCGAGTLTSDPQHWSHAVHLQWSDTQPEKLPNR